MIQVVLIIAGPSVLLASTMIVWFISCGRKCPGKSRWTIPEPARSMKDKPC